MAFIDPKFFILAVMFNWSPSSTVSFTERLTARSVPPTVVKALFPLLSTSHSVCTPGCDNSYGMVTFFVSLAFTVSGMHLSSATGSTVASIL